jgi:hypothetical protein
LKLSKIAVNAAAIEAGRWVSVAHTLPGVKFKVRGLNNADYRRLEAKLLAEVPRSDRIKGIDPDTLDRIKVNLLVETVLTDWSGLEDDNGNMLTWTKQTAAKYLFDPNYVVLRSAVEWAAAVVGEDDLVELEEDAKN